MSCLLHQMQVGKENQNVEFPFQIQKEPLKSGSDSKVGLEEPSWTQWEFGNHGPCWQSGSWSREQLRLDDAEAGSKEEAGRRATGWFFPSREKQSWSWGSQKRESEAWLVVRTAEKVLGLSTWEEKSLWEWPGTTNQDLFRVTGLLPGHRTPLLGHRTSSRCKITYHIKSKESFELFSYPP